MRRPPEQHHNEMIESACERAAWRLGEDTAQEVSGYLRRYYARVPLDDIEGRSPDALFGAAYAHWRLAGRRTLGTPTIRVYNPALDEDGWTSPHTVVDIVTDDMPFLVDSVIAEVNRQDLPVHLVVHPVLRLIRDDTGCLQGLAEPTVATGAAESFMHVEITRCPSVELARVAAGIAAVLRDVAVAVGDWLPIRNTLEEVLSELRAATEPSDEIDETVAFLDWIRENNFTFLGHRRYRLERIDEVQIARDEVGSGLGLLRDPERRVLDDLRDGEALPPAVADFVRRRDLLSVTKSHLKSTVHRPAPIDVIMVKRFDAMGHPSGQHLFAGLFSAATYHRSARNIPFLRRKIARALEHAGFEPRSHDGRALVNIVETFPRDELFQVSDEQLLSVALGILHLQHRQRVAVFIRQDDFERFLSCLVFVPRDRYTTQLRLAIHGILERAVAGRIAAQYLQVGDAPLARLHIIVETTPGRSPPFDVREIEAAIAAAAQSWSERLLAALVAAHGEEDGRRLHQRYGEAFPLGYRERFTAAEAIGDIAASEEAIAQERISMALYRPFGASERVFRFKVYQPDQPIVLSDVLPILEHLGLKVVDEVPHAVRVRGEGLRSVMIHDFGLEAQGGQRIALGEIGERFREAFLSVWSQQIESDRLNALVLSAGLSVHEVTILRAYTRYLRQVGIPFTQAYLERVLTTHPLITGRLVRLFLALFDPQGGDDLPQRAETLRGEIAAALDGVSSAEDDRILRRFLNLIEATLRTTYFQANGTEQRKPYLALKLDSRKVEDLPLPRPMVEIFVYAVRFEGIHLRGGKVARGGLRWSDRREDFRTEVLGLMKAQMVKNAVIVPIGAKGGFVVKSLVDPGDREAWQTEGTACYRMFIHALLDLTDNLAATEVVPPAGVVRRDGDDPYLVVAADKGTATFSDRANDVALSHGFWLGDAFASGGSRGYDHKAMGITARGAWESVKRHFRELGRNIQQQDFTVVGVGDMSGDVFGNGMLLSPHIRLLAAFDHRHIFVDPDPDPVATFAERQRLFALPRSSWQDFDRAILSAGGAVYDRRAKMLTLTPQIRARFGLPNERMTPSELIQHVLRAEVDLLWFGGIGTYVKASSETHAEVGDRATDALRVDACSLRCAVVGEGANLGVTQLGRIEFARNGGRINTDFIDNSAGVDCSDHEVNIKILLDTVVREGDLTNKQRNGLLTEMTDEVTAHVLRDNYLQTQAISLIEAEGHGGLDGYIRLMRMLERLGRINRSIEFLPDDEALVERSALRQGLTRPEIAVLFAHCKLWLYDEILGSDLPDDPYLAEDVARYFPRPIRERLGEQIVRHRLRRELVTTAITNSLVNRMGGVFVSDIGEKTGMRPAEISRAYIMARDVFAVREVWDDIEALDGQLSGTLQAEVFREVQLVLEKGATWFLRDGGAAEMATKIGSLQPALGSLMTGIENLLPDHARQRLRSRAAAWAAGGVPESLGVRIARLSVLPAACDIIRIAEARGIGADDVAELYFGIGERLGFAWLRERIAGLSIGGHWPRLAVHAMVEELQSHQRELTIQALPVDGGSMQDALEQWCNARQAAFDRSRTMLLELEAAADVDLSMLVVASHHLRALIDA